MRPLHLHSLPVVVLDVPRREDIDRSHRIVIPATRAEPAQLFPGLVMRAHPSPKHGPGGGHGGPGAAGRRPRRRRVHGEDSVGRQVQVSKAARARAGPPAAADSGPAPGPWRIGRRAAIGLASCPGTDIMSARVPERNVSTLVQVSTLAILMM